MPKLTLFSSADTAPTYDRPRPDRLLKGNPLRTTYEHFLSTNGSRSAGVWHCETGAWNIAFAPGKDEFFCVIEGRLRISDHEGNAHEFSAGQACVIPGGFTGVFEVLEPVRKYYVLVETQP